MRYSPFPLHLAAFHIAPLRDVSIRLRRATPTSRVHSPLAGGDLAFDAAEGVVKVTVPRIDTHAMIVFEGGG